MPAPGSKHRGADGDRAQILAYGPFRGLNLSAPAEQIGRNELTEAVNVEFADDSGLSVRPGMVPMLHTEADVADMIHIGGLGHILRLTNGKLCLLRSWVLYTLGTASGDGPLSAARWENDGDLLIATGGKLQRVKDLVFSTIDGSPEHCHVVFVRSGRVGVSADDDTFYFSAVGDPGDWTENPDNAKSSQWLQVGYKDGLDVRAVGVLSKDIIVFKSSRTDGNSAGTVYRIIGDFPDVRVAEAAHDTGTYSQQTIRNVGNDLLYLTREGMAALSAVVQYGDVQVNWPDMKIKPRLLEELALGEPRMFTDEDKQQIWVQTHERIWVMHYGHGGDWTTFEFPVPITAAANGLVAYKNYLYRLHRMAGSDEVQGEGTYPLSASVGLKTEYSALQSLLKAVMVSFSARAKVEMDWVCNGRAVLPLFRYAGLSEGDIVFSDGDIAYLDDDPLWPAGSGGARTARKKCLVRGWALANRIEIRGSQFVLTGAAVQMVEV
jgi:hypothetical protein